MDERVQEWQAPLTLAARRPRVNNTEFLKTAGRYPAEAGGWTLGAARDFSYALQLLARCKPGSAEHMGVLSEAVTAYARPFTLSASRAFNQNPQHTRCFMEIASDLGADVGVHARILIARAKLLTSSDLVAGYRFVYPTSRCARILSRVDASSFARHAALMRLACVFFLAEVVMPVPDSWHLPG